MSRPSALVWGVPFQGIIPSIVARVPAYRKPRVLLRTGRGLKPGPFAMSGWMRKRIRSSQHWANTPARRGAVGTRACRPGR